MSGAVGGVGQAGPEDSFDALAAGVGPGLPRLLYTWTGRDQAVALRTAPVLLSRSSSPGRGVSRFDRGLGDTPTDRLLRRPDWALRRFAWPAAWATASGFDAERYGDVLVAALLRPDAIVGWRVPGAAWRFTDLAGAPVAEAEALAGRRLAAVVHVHPGGPDALPFREVVLVREAMIERWSLGTPALAAILTTAAQQLESLATRPGCSAAAACPPALADGAAQRAWAEALARDVWTATGPAALPLDHYLRGLALSGRDYHPTPERLRALAARLRALAADQPPALEHRPDADRPASAGSPGRAPKRPRGPQGTFWSYGKP